jgi:hypothetical protein
LDFLNELLKLLAFAWAHVKEANANGVAVMNCLHNAAEAEGKALNTELGFNAGVDAERETLDASNAATTQTEIEDAAFKARADLYKNDVGRSIDTVPGVIATLRRWRIVGVCGLVFAAANGCVHHVLLRRLGGQQH